jgi:hypothetical protein
MESRAHAKQRWDKRPNCSPVRESVSDFDETDNFAHVVLERPLRLTFHAIRPNPYTVAFHAYTALTIRAETWLDDNTGYMHQPINLVGVSRQ